jgi:hypothetical protein
VTTYRAEIGEDNLVGLKDNLDRILASKTTDQQYERFLSRFEKKPTVPGTLLNWVCRDDEDYLDLDDDRLDLNPAQSDGAPEPNESESRVAEFMALRQLDAGSRPEVQWHPLSRLPLIAQLIDEGVKDANTQHDLLLQGEKKPYLFDDETIDRIILVYLETLDFVEIYQEQLDRWKKEKLTKKQDAELVRLVEQCRYLKVLAMAILAMADQIAAATIDKIIGMDEAELALKVLLGEIPLT